MNGWRWKLAGWVCMGVIVAQAQTPPAKYPGTSFDILRRRVDVDVDGAPTAYGPKGFKTLDTEHDARYRGRWYGPIVGYMTEHGHPVVQGPHDPAPGYYVSQTTFEDERYDEHDPRRYVDATRINYVVLGDEARRRGARIGDFVAAYSKKTGRSVFGIVGDAGNPSGDEASLHLLQALGYPFKDGRDESVEHADVTIRYFPDSNPKHLFFHAQTALDAAARSLGLSKTFSAAPGLKQAK